MEALKSSEFSEHFEHFLHLTSEKQHVIINAALHSFGHHGYKKASVSDIAKEAGISKAMIFHYFGSKKNLYLYLTEVSADVLVKGVMKRIQNSGNDFFDRIKLISQMKISVLREYPNMYAFMESMYFEKDPEVAKGIKSMLAQTRKNMDIMQFFEGVDYMKFKEGIDPMFVLKIIMYISEGCINANSKNGEMNIPAIMNEHDKYLALFKNNFYRRAAGSSV